MDKYEFYPAPHRRNTRMINNNIKICHVHVSQLVLLEYECEDFYSNSLNPRRVRSWKYSQIKNRHMLKASNQ